MLARSSKLAGHPGQSRMFYTFSCTYNWPHMAVDISAIVRNCHSFARHRVKLRKHLNRLELFLATRPFKAGTIYILGPLPSTLSGKQFLLVIKDRFTKLTKVSALRKITDGVVNVAFYEVWVFKYGLPVSLLLDSALQSASKLLQSVCRMLDITIVYKSAYHLQTNGQVKSTIYARRDATKLHERSPEQRR